MSTHGSNNKPTEYVPQSPAINNWVYIKHKFSGEHVIVMNIYDYRKARRFLIMNDPQQDPILFMGIIKPKDPYHYLIINQGSGSLISYLENYETNDKKTD